jgi:tetracycline resistance efflux pump
MNAIHHAHTIWALIPPVLAIIFAVATRKVLWSLGLGIISGVLLTTSGNILHAISYLLHKVYNLVSLSNIFLIGFLLSLGLVMSYLSHSGSAHALAEWAKHRIHSRKQAQLVTIALSFAIFIDDYFHALTAGNIARPMTDRLKISRAKLAFLLDSTAAPICVLVPLSSWGAYIIGLIAEINTSSQHNPLSLYAASIPLNFYAICTLILVICTVIWQLDIGTMKTFERRAQQGEDISASLDSAHTIETSSEEHSKDLRRLLVTITGLIITTIVTMFVSGWWQIKDSNTNTNMIQLLENAQVPLALLCGSIVGVILSIPGLPKKSYSKATRSGLKSMLPAILILLFAWTLASIIKDLETGKYLANLVKNHSIPIEWLPLAIFWVSGAMAFSTGTSWGTFGIMLPLAAEMTFAVPGLSISAMFGATLAGSVFGDHCSPISDTTILSATGAHCRLMDHVVSQLPYAMISALASSAAYIIFGFSQSVLSSWIGALLVIVLAIFIMRTYSSKATNPMVVK